MVQAQQKSVLRSGMAPCGVANTGRSNFQLVNSQLLGHSDGFDRLSRAFDREIFLARVTCDGVSCRALGGKECLPPCRESIERATS